LPEEVKKDVSSFSINIQNTVMSTFAHFEKRGEIRGETKNKIEIAQNMHENGFTIAQICTALNETEEFVKKAIESKKK